MVSYDHSLFVSLSILILEMEALLFSVLKTQISLISWICFDANLVSALISWFLDTPTAHIFSLTGVEQKRMKIQNFTLL